MKDDDQLMYEAYVNSLMKEAPIEMSGDYNISDPAREKSTQYKLSDKGLDLIIQHIKSLFPSNETGEHGPLNLEDQLGKLSKKNVSMWLREQIKSFSVPRAGEKDEEGNVVFPAATKHTYFSRVISNDMLNDEDGEPFIGISDTGQLEVDVDQEDNVKGDIKADIVNQVPVEDDAPVTTGKFDRKVEYDVDPLAGETLPKRHRDVVEYVVDYEGETGQEILNGLKSKMLFNNPEIAGGFDGNEMRLIKVLNDLITSGILIPSQKSSEDQEAKAIDSDDPEDRERADKDYIDNVVRQANWGAETPAMRPDDF